MEQLYTWLFFTILLHQTVSCYSITPEQLSITLSDDCPYDQDYCTKDSSLTNKSRDDVDGKKERIPWYGRLPLLPVLFATSPTLHHGECKRQVQKYLEELNSGTLWAVRMFDSSTKYPDGILAGHTRHYGNFDECIETEYYSSESDAGMIGGKYCLVKVEYQKLNTSNDRIEPHTLDFDPNGSVLEAIKEKRDFRRVKRYLLELALCIPDVCSASDVEKVLREPLRKIGIEQQMIIKTGIKGECQSKKDTREFSKWSKTYCCLILGLFLAVGMGTWYDAILSNVDEKVSKSLILDILLCFSVQRNYKSITAIKDSHPGLDCIYLFRVFFMCCTLLGHGTLQYFTSPTINMEFLEYVYTLPFMIVLYNGTIIIEVFFVFGGILFAYYMLVELDKRKKMNFMAAILIRYIRLTPSYFIVIMFITSILPHLGSGPYWEYKIGLDSGNCGDNWWTNILYINNYINTEKMCMFQSWYVSADFHLYIMALIVIYFFWKMPRRIGYPFLTIIIVGGNILPFILSYFYHVQPLHKPILHLHDVREDPYFTGHYIKTHERISSYFVGVLGGAIIYDHSLSPWRMPKPWRYLPLIPGAFLIGIKSQTMGLKFYDPNVITTPIEAGLYAIFGKLGIAVAAVSVIVLISASDESGFHHKLFKPRWAQPFAKLTYGVYLIHNIHQIYDIGVVRNAKTYTTHNVIRDLVVDVVFSFSLSFILAMVIEGPFRKLEKRLLTKRSHEPM